MAAALEDESLFGWDATPGIVSVWADHDGQALVWRRVDGAVVEGERVGIGGGHGQTVGIGVHGSHPSRARGLLAARGQDIPQEFDGATLGP